MRAGMVRPDVVVAALVKLGGIPRNKGGEVKVKFSCVVITERGAEVRGTTITVGRKPFSRPMLKKRIYAKLTQVGIHPSAFDKLV